MPDCYIHEIPMVHIEGTAKWKCPKCDFTLYGIQVIGKKVEQKSEVK